jgi:hypothetical protein
MRHHRKCLSRSVFGVGPPEVQLTCGIWAGGTHLLRALTLQEDEWGTPARAFRSMAKGIVRRRQERPQFVARVVYDIAGNMRGASAHCTGHKTRVNRHALVQHLCQRRSPSWPIRATSGSGAGRLPGPLPVREPVREIHLLPVGSGVLFRPKRLPATY